MAVRSNQEMGGFKLLEEDALDDRPCPAVKQFVSSILDRKDMKDKEVASSFRSLMEYRDSTSSPSTCSARTYSSTVDGDRMNSPPSPSSDTTLPGPMDDQRLPNELLDEICEDIGMKEGMELDFVEYLMEQDTNPHLYMTQEAISSTTFSSASVSNISTASGSISGGSNNSSGNKTLTHSTSAVAATTTTTTTTPNFLFKATFTNCDWPHPLAMSNSYQSSSSNSSGSTTVKSSENNSPAHKRVHLSTPVDANPGKGQSQVVAPTSHYNSSAGLNSCNWPKLPQPGLVMARQGSNYFHNAPASSPIQFTHSSISQGFGSSCHPGQPQDSSRSQEMGMAQTFPSSQPGDLVRDPSELKDSSANSHMANRCPTNTSGSSNSSGRSMCSMPLKLATSSSYDFTKHQSSGQLSVHGNLPPGSTRNQNDCMEKLQPPPNMVVSSNPQHNHLYHQQQQQSWTASAHMQTNTNMPSTYFKGICPPGAYSTQHVHVAHHNHPGLVTMPGHHSQIRTPVDSPLDQGYFSNESAGNCSSGSAASPAFTSSSMSSLASTSTMMPAEHSQRIQEVDSIQQQQQQQQQQQISGQPGGRPNQKSVHFADMTEGSPPTFTDSPGSSSMDMKPAFGPGTTTSVDCSFETDSNGQPKVMPAGKILPRFNHSMKSGIAPYTVPSSQSQVMGPTVPSSSSPGYDMTTRPTCAVTSDHRSGTAELVKPPQPGCGGENSAFFMDNNQNVMRVDTGLGYSPYPPPLIIPQTGEFVHGQQDPGSFGAPPYHSLHQQQMCQSQQTVQQIPPTDSSSCQAHHRLLPMQQQQQQYHQPHQQFQFSSCCPSTRGMGSEVDTHHQKNMQISNNNNNSSCYQMHLNVPTASSNQVSCNSDLGVTYGGQEFSPHFESASSQSGYADVYSNQQTSHGMLGHQDSVGFHRGWRTGMSRGEEVQVGMHPVSSTKGGLQLSHSHMQPSLAQGCAAPMDPGPHVSMMNPSIGPPHPHVDSSHPHMGSEYGLCVGLPCNSCKIGHPSQQHSHMGQCEGTNFHMYKANHPPDGSLHPQTLTHAGPCAGPGCTACKLNQTGRPQILSSQQKFIQHLIMDESNSAYRSHPLFPLLRDLVIAEMNFDNPKFHYQQLLSLLPNDFNKLLQNFLHRNPPSGHYQSNHAVESVIMDSLRLAHGNLLDKIRSRQELETIKANSSASLRSMEEFCHKFDHSVSGPMQRESLQMNGVNSVTLNHHPMGTYHQNGYGPPGVSHVYHTVKDRADMFGDPALSSPQVSKAESKKHPSLPKEAVAMMMEWLRSHKDNPYPNDDEKALLIKQTGLSVNQINYWFTNARRRILPKWSQCKT